MTTLRDIPDMGAPAPVQRPLAEGLPARVHTFPKAASDTEVAPTAPDDDPHAADDGVSVNSLAELQALMARGGPLADEPHDGGAIDDAARLLASLEPAPQLFDPAANDFVPSAGDGISIDPSRAPVLALRAFHASVIDSCGDRLLSLARDRYHHPIQYRTRDEQRMLAQVDAIVCVGEHGIAALLDWRQRAGTPDATWAAVFALACMEGREPLEAIATLPIASFDDAVCAGDALAASPNPHLVPLARTLIEGGNAVLRVFAIEALSKRGAITMAALLDWLAADNPLLQRAALRAMVRSPEIAPLSAIEARLDSDDPDVAWQAAHACTLLGSTAAYLRLRERGPLAVKLGARAIEIYVMTGEPDDLASLQRIVNGEPMTPRLLSAVARFGHPGTWSFLSHYLDDVVLQDHARAALETLFGSCVAEHHALDRFAWEAAIGALRLSAQTRVRRGHPWSPEVVVAEWADGELSATEIQLRLDELRTRGGVAAQVPLHAWADVPAAALSEVAAQAVEAARTHRAGSWHWR